MLGYLKCALDKGFKPSPLWFVGEDVLNEVGVDMESYFKELLTKAMGWEQTLLCV
jgi:hypothetical protein